MAQRIFKAQIKPVNCTIQSDVDRLVTKEGLSLTPSRIKELTDRGIAVSLPNSQNFIAPSESAARSWDIDPMFKRDATMCSMWEQEQSAKQKVLNAHKKDKQIYG